MAGTNIGGKQAALTNKERHGEDFYKKIGAKGGHKSRGGGFASNSKLASEASHIRWDKYKENRRVRHENITRSVLEIEEGL